MGSPPLVAALDQPEPPAQDGSRRATTLLAWSPGSIGMCYISYRKRMQIQDINIHKNIMNINKYYMIHKTYRHTHTRHTQQKKNIWCTFCSDLTTSRGTLTFIFIGLLRPNSPYLSGSSFCRQFDQDIEQRYLKMYEHGVVSKSYLQLQYVHALDLK